MKFNLRLLPDNFVKGLNILDMFNLTFGDDGVEITAYESDCLRVNFDGRLNIGYSKISEFYRGITLFVSDNFSKEINVVQKSNFDNLSIMADESRNGVATVKTIKQTIRLMAVMGYNQLQLYTEDTYELENEPYFGYLRGRYTKLEIKEVVAYAKIYGIEIVPCIQTLAHYNSIARWNAYQPIIDCNDILLLEEKSTYELLEKIFIFCRECYDSDKINIGMDEAHMLGLGKYLDKHGYKNRYEILLTHLNKVAELSEKYHFKPMMWSDMFFKLALGGYYNEGEVPLDVVKKVPENISLIYWHYYCEDENAYTRMMQKHKKFNREIYFAGGAVSWLGFTPYNECSIKYITASMNSAFATKTKNYILTLWGDNGAECPLFNLLPAICYAAEKAYANEINVAKNFQNITSVDFYDFIGLDLANKITPNLTKLFNPSKYYLYNDTLLGIFDKTIKSFDAKIYDNYIVKLKVCEKNKKFGYLFTKQILLCEILKLKIDLGVKTREFYKSKDILALKKLVSERYKPLIALVSKFIDAEYNEWMSINKPQGYEVQDIRLGGLLQRLKTSVKRIEKYILNKIDIIAELEEEILPLIETDEVGVRFNKWTENVTTNIM